MRKTLISSLVIACLPGAIAAAAAQSYPTRTIRMIVPFSPGGASDAAGRLIGQKLSERLGQQVVIENRPGAGGVIGTEVAAKARGDGYTLLLGSSTELAQNPNLYRKLPYDTTRDFVPIALAAATPLLLVTHPSLPAKSVADLVGLAKKRPGEINYASSGNGSTTHLAAEMLKRAASIDLVHVPHKGSAPAVVSLLAGETHMGLIAIPAVLPHARAGKLRGLAVSSAKRAEVAPEIPTLMESGYPNFDIVIWTAVVAPTGTPADVVAKLESEILAILALPDVRRGFANQGAEMTPGDGKKLGAFIRSELAKFAKVVKESGARID